MHLGHKFQLWYILVFLFSDTIFICGWTCLSNCVYPTKKKAQKLCHYIKSLLMNSNNFIPPNRPRLPNNMVHHMLIQDILHHLISMKSCWKKKGDIVSTYQYAFIAEIFYQYVSPTIYHQKHTSTNHAMPYGSGKKKTTTTIHPSPSSSSQQGQVNGSNRPTVHPTALGLQKSCTVSKLETLTFTLFFFREGKKPNQQKSNEKSNG